MRHVRDIELIQLSVGRLADDAPARQHLESCAECRRRYDEIRAVDSALGVWDVPSVSADLWPAIEWRLRSSRTSPLPLVSRWAASLLRVAAAVLIGVGLGHGTARMWHPTAHTATSSLQNVDASLALYALESPSSTGLVLVLHEPADLDRTDGVP